MAVLHVFHEVLLSFLKKLTVAGATQASLLFLLVAFTLTRMSFAVVAAELPRIEEDLLAKLTWVVFLRFS